MCVAHKWHINYYTHLGTDLIAALACLQVHYFPHIDCLIELDKGQVNLSRCVKAWSLTDSICTETEIEIERVCLIHTRTHTHTRIVRTARERRGTVRCFRYDCSAYSVSDRRARVENPTCTEVGRGARDWATHRPSNERAERESERGG